MAPNERLRNPPLNPSDAFTLLDGPNSRKALSLSVYRYFTFLRYFFPRVSSPNPQTLAEAGLYISEKGVECQFCFGSPIPIEEFIQMANTMSILEIKEHHVQSSPYCPINEIKIFNTPMDVNPIDKKFESYRLRSLLRATYENPNLWKDANPLKRCLDLAKSGFSFEGPGDIVCCFSCGATLTDMDAEDLADTEHKECNPHCNFLTQPHTSGNVALGEEEIVGVGADSNMFACPDDAKRSFPNYEDLNVRVNSFVNWEHDASAFLKAEKMANAGFFYTGEKDLVACFHCGIGLEGWNPQIDQPEVLHNSLRTNCPCNHN